MRGHIVVAVRRVADVAAEHLDLCRAWICLAPAMRRDSDDLPMPSGPISPTMHAGGNGERHAVERDRARRSAG